MLLFLPVLMLLSLLLLLLAQQADNFVPSRVALDGARSIKSF